MKRNKVCEYSEIEKALVKWFKQYHEKNVLLSGPNLQEKVRNFATLLKVDNFSASNGSLDGFKRRHDITFTKICSDSKDVNNNICCRWLDELPRTLENYSMNDICNVDETASSKSVCQTRL